MAKHRAIILSCAALAVIAVSSYAVSAGSQPGCDPSSDLIAESDQFTPYELQRSAFDAELPAGETAAVSAADTLSTGAAEQLPTRQLDVVTDGGAVYSYYLGQPVGGMRVSEFIKAGGIQIHREPMFEKASFAEHLLANLGERATSVAVGPYKGAMTWADPDMAGNRTHNLYWSDGEFNYAVILDAPAHETLNLGRSLVCGQ